MDPDPEIPRAPEPEYLVVWSDASGPPPFHVRDQERRIATLPPCDLAPADRAGLAPVALAPYPATVWLPDPAAADPVEGPDDGCQGWDWPTGEFLMLMFHPSPGLPGLHALVGYDAWTTRAELAGRPIAVTRPPVEAGASDDADRAGAPTFRAQVGGYVDDRTSFWADVDAPSAGARDRLLAALLTLTPDGARRPASGAPRPNEASQLSSMQGRPTPALGTIAPRPRCALTAPS